jgi:hypothetical protein
MTTQSSKHAAPQSPTNLDQLKRDAKRLAKLRRLTHSQALDLVANEHGFRNWQLLHRAIDGLNVQTHPAESPPTPESPDGLLPREQKTAHLPSSTGLQIHMAASRGEVMLMKGIVERFERLVAPREVDRLSTMMDLEACHCNGCPLDLQALLDAESDADLVHDVAGITRHLDRDSGTLVNYFRPRYSA